MGRLMEKVLTENIVELNKRLNCRAALLDYLISAKPNPILSIFEKDDILSKPTSYERNDALVTRLMTKPDSTLDVLYAYLKVEPGYTELATALEKSATEHGHHFQAHGMPEVGVAAQMSATTAAADADFPIVNHAQRTELRKYLEESRTVLNALMTVKEDFVDKAIHLTAIEVKYHGHGFNSKAEAISDMLEHWCSRGTSVATFNNLIKIIRQVDTSVADKIEADRGKIRALGTQTK